MQVSLGQGLTKWYGTVQFGAKTEGGVPKHFGIP